MNQAGAAWCLGAYTGAVRSFTVQGSEGVGMPSVAYNAEAYAKSGEEMRSDFVRLFR